jgi:hypothetical protein
MVRLLLLRLQDNTYSSSAYTHIQTGRAVLLFCTGERDGKSQFKQTPPKPLMLSA